LDLGVASLPYFMLNKLKIRLLKIPTLLMRYFN